MKNNGFQAAKALVILFLIIGVVMPLITLLCNINPEDLAKIISSPQFQPMMIHSLVATTIATLISVGLALTLAWCVNRTHIRYKAIFSMLFTLPMLIPSISHGMGLVLLLGDNGILTNALGLDIGLYGYPGIIIGSVLYSFPVAFLMLTDIFKYEDYTVYEAAQVLGLSKSQQFLRITLPNLKGALISVIFAVFTMIFTDYGVPLVVGGKLMTLPVYMYREVIGLLDFSKGAIIGIILLIPALIAFLIDLKSEESSNASTVTMQYQIESNPQRDIVAYLLCVITVIFISLPILAFAYLSVVKQFPVDMSLSLDNIKKALDLGVVLYLKNALAIALATSLIGTVVIYFTAYITARSPKSFTTLTIHLISLITLAIPGVVLGLCYVLFFKGNPIYGTLIILILVNSVHFFASPYLVAYHSLHKFNKNLEDISATMGISKLRMLKDVYLPSTKDSLIEIFSYLFVNCMVTISAVSFLANFKNLPIALLIPQFDAQSLIEATAFVSMIILIVNGFVKLAVYLIKRFALNEE